jgi:hypothetical protein
MFLNYGKKGGSVHLDSVRLQPISKVRTLQVAMMHNTGALWEPGGRTWHVAESAEAYKFDIRFH